MKKIPSIFLFLISLTLSANVFAASIISDDETESYLYDMLRPIFNAASLPLNHNYIHILKDDSLNAFVGDKNHMFVHTGTLLKASSTNELEGVLAHETGHILGGHILRLKIKMQDLQKATLASLLAAGAAAAASGRGDAAIAVVLGTQSAAINSISAYQVSEERAADETAVLLLDKNNKSISGLKNFMQKIQKENRLQGFEENLYFRTHPVTNERVSFFNERLQKEGVRPNNTLMDGRLRRIQAKLFAYLMPLPQILKKYPLQQSTTEARIAHTVYYMRQRNLSAALAQINQLLAAEPDNQNFWELKAQALFESGKLKEAATAYKKTLSLKPSSDLFKLSYAEAVLASSPAREEVTVLIPLLEQAALSQSYPEAYLHLGRVYDILGQSGTAAYFAAEYNAAIGEKAIARRQLSKALKQQLRPEIKLRAEDLQTKLLQEDKKTSLF